jgi:hypothetical protein
MKKRSFSIKEAAKFGVKFIRNNAKIYIIMAIIESGAAYFYHLDSSIASKLLTQAQGLSRGITLIILNHILWILYFILTLLVGIIVGIGFIQIASRWYDYNKVSVRDLWPSSFSVVFRVIAGIFKFFILSLLYAILLIIPGIYYFLTYSFFEFFIIDKNLGVRNAFKQSYICTRGVKWKLLGFFLIVESFSSIHAYLVRRISNFSYETTLFFLLLLSFSLLSILVRLMVFHIYRQLLNEPLTE